MSAPVLSADELTAPKERKQKDGMTFRKGLEPLTSGLGNPFYANYINKLGSSKLSNEELKSKGISIFVQSL